MGEGVTVVIPAFNEADRLPRTLDHLLIEMPEYFGGRWEIVVADDGSTDATPAVVSAYAGTAPIRGVRNAVNQGKGAALVSGARHAVFPHVVFLDADLPVSVETIAGMVNRVATVDLVVGSRCQPGSRIDPPQPQLRRLGGRGFRAAIRLLGYDATSDPQCGAKVLQLDRMRPVLDAVITSGFAFDVELIVRARRLGRQVVEVPVVWSHVEGSSLRPMRDAVTTLLALARLRSRIDESQLAVH